MPPSERLQLVETMEKTRSKVLRLLDGSDQSGGLNLLILGATKFCSTRPLQELKPITFKDMQVTKTHKGRVLLLRIVSVPCYIVGISFAAEDTNGRVEHITIYNLPLHGIRTGPDLDALFPVGALCAIREPSFKMGGSENGHAVRCDSASDFYFLEPDSPILADARWPGPAPAEPRPASFDWKALGNGYFAQRKDYLAVRAYSEGLARCSSPEQRLVYYLNRAQANLRLNNFGGAWRDTSAVLSFLKAGISGGPPRAELKATIRRARALTGLRHLERAHDEYNRAFELDQDELEVLSGRGLVGALLSQRDTGECNWAGLEELATGWMAPSGLPVADYFGPIKIARLEQRLRGRGIVATKAMKAGDLIIDLTSDTIADTSKAELVTALAARMMDDSSVASLIYNLHGGPRYPASGDFAPTAMRDRPLLPFATHATVDTTRLEAISLVNAFPLGRHKIGYEFIDNYASGLFLVASMLNHSCQPNAHWMNLGDVVIVRARTAIAPGDEICISYVPSASSQTVADNILRQRAMTACGCVMCEEMINDGSDQINLRHKLLDDNIPKYSQIIHREGAAGLKSRRNNKPALAKLIKRIEATYPKDGISFRPDLVMPYLVISEFCDTTTDTGAAESVAWARKALVASGADFVDDEAGKITPTAAPISQIGNMMVLMLRNASMYVWDGGVVGHEGFAWLAAAVEMSRILYGDTVASFAVRFASRLVLYGLDKAVRRWIKEAEGGSG